MLEDREETFLTLELLVLVRFVCSSSITLDERRLEDPLEREFFSLEVSGVTFSISEVLSLFSSVFCVHHASNNNALLP